MRPVTLTKESLENMLSHLSRIVRGEFSVEQEVRQAAAVDGSIFTVLPAAVFYPKDAGDIQAVTHYLYKQAEAGMPIPSLTARGKGSDQAGGPLNTGIIVDCTRHLTQILEIGSDFVRVQPGCRYGELQAELKKRGRYLPPYPASLEICTIGGAVANNSSGEKTVKYGDTRDYVQALKVILASGDEVLLTSLDINQVEAKEHRRNFEGKVYREMQRLLQAHTAESEHPTFHTSKNSTGYCIWQILNKENFDLTKLFVGSQGTLGIVTEITLKTVPYPKAFALIAGYFDSIDKAALATEEILELAPSALEIVDKNLINLVNQQQPGHLYGLIPKKIPEIALIIEFDEADAEKRADKAEAAKNILNTYAYSQREAKNPIEQDQLWRLRRSAAAVIWTVKTPEKALPVVEDGVVPAKKLPEFFKRAYALFDKYDLKIAIWGHAGDANLHMQPFMDLSKEKDRQKIWPFVDEFHHLIFDMGGCISAEHNDGLLRAPYLQEQYGEELYTLFRKVKRIFDPYAMFNPGKKVDVNLEEVKKLLRSTYNLDHLVQNAEQINR